MPWSRSVNFSPWQKLLLQRSLCEQGFHYKLNRILRAEGQFSLVTERFIFRFISMVLLFQYWSYAFREIKKRNKAPASDHFSQRFAYKNSWQKVIKPKIAFEPSNMATPNQPFNVLANSLRDLFKSYDQLEESLKSKQTRKVWTCVLSHIRSRVATSSSR